jgi:aminoacrylate hydrolase
VVVLIAGLGGSGSYWLPQLAALEPEYQVVCYDQRGRAITRHPAGRLQHGADGGGAGPGAG